MNGLWARQAWNVLGGLGASNLFARVRPSSLTFSRYASKDAASPDMDLGALRVDKGLTRVDGYDVDGFVVNDHRMAGSIIAFRTCALSWKTTRLADVTPESLEVFDLLAPAPELLVFGTGARMRQVPPSLAMSLRKKGISMEVMDSAMASSTFNILNQEGRNVVAALLQMSDHE
eukprot:jgi/Mesvir1/2207/Mv09852-RA.1